MRKCGKSVGGSSEIDLKLKGNTRLCMSHDLHERQFSTFMLCNGALASRWRCFVTFRLDNASLVCMSGCFIRCIGTATHVHNVSDNIDGLKRPVEYKFLFAKTVFRASDSNIFLFVCLKFCERSQIRRVYDRDMCAKRISTILSDFLFAC